MKTDSEGLSGEVICSTEDNKKTRGKAISITKQRKKRAASEKGEIKKKRV